MSLAAQSHTHRPPRMNIFLTNAAIYYWMAAGNHVPDLHPSLAVGDRGGFVRCIPNYNRSTVYLPTQMQETVPRRKMECKNYRTVVVAVEAVGMWWPHGGSSATIPNLLLDELRSSDCSLHIRLFTITARVLVGARRAMQVLYNCCIGGTYYCVTICGRLVYVLR